MKNPLPDSQPPMNADLPPPVTLAIIVADEVSIDPGTGKPTARGTYFAVTEVARPVAFEIRLLDPDKNPIHRAGWSIDSADPLRIHGLVAVFRDVAFTRPGVHRVQATFEGAIIAEQPLTVYTCRNSC